MNKIIIIDGNNFNTLDGFYDEVVRVMTKDLNWDVGRNLDALNDILSGGFGVFKFEEQVNLVWKNSNKSKNDLGYLETVKYLEKRLIKCHSSNTQQIEKELLNAKNGKDQTIFERIIEIINTHNHIQLIQE